MDIFSDVQLHFSEGSLWILNISLAFIMFGVALNLRVNHFKDIFNRPVPVFAGLLSQFLLLPALTFLITLLLKPPPGIALGMILVASCPGGNVSNFLTLMAKGNAALSVTLTAFSSTLAFIATPLNFGFWASLNPETAGFLKDIALDPFDMVLSLAVILALPLSLGLWLAEKRPNFAQKINRPMRIFSLLIFAGFVSVAFAGNFDYFVDYIHVVFFLVLAHNGLALVLGYGLGWALRLDEADRRCLSIETGIQNSGLGLFLIFAFFGGAGGMALITAWWGLWDLVSGLAIAWTWSRFKVKKA